MNKTQGYFLIALGKHHIDESVALVDTIRKQGDTRPVGVLIHPLDMEYAKNKGVFSKFVLFNPDASFNTEDRLWKDCKTPQEKYCIYPRLYLNDYLPFDENIIVDSDVLCQYNPDSIWKALKFGAPIQMVGKENDPSWHWGRINEVSAAYGKQVPHTHGGFFYLRKDSFLKEFFAYARGVFYKYDEYRCLRNFRGGMTDEVIFAITFAHFDMVPLDFDDIPIMTFNYTPDIEIPSKLQTEGERPREISDYIPFVHMFDKLGGPYHTSLYKRIMEK